MKFEVIQDAFDGEICLRLVNNDNGEYCQVLPFLGGTIHSAALRAGGEVVRVVDGYADSAEIRDQHTRVFRGANLFPFPNRVDGGAYRFAGASFQLPINFASEDNAIHGLVHSEPFTILNTEKRDDLCRLVLEYQPQEPPPWYPFPYRLEHTYSLGINSGFSCTTLVENLSRVPMPLGHGWHPYFSLGNAPVDDLLLMFPANRVFAADDRMIPTGRAQSYSAFNSLRRIGTTQFDHCFALEEKNGRAELLLGNLELGIFLKLWLETGKEKYNYVQIYIPPARDTIALEPMTCIPDSLNNLIGLIELAPGKSVSFSWGMALETKNPLS